MGVNRGAFRSRWGRAGLACFLAGVLGLGLTPAHAGTTAASITGFVPNPFGPNGPGGRYVRTGSWQDVFGKAMATAEYTAPAAGTIVTGTATMVAAEGAGAAVARFCLASPLVCAGGAAAAWFIASRIRQEDGHYVVDEDGYGACYQVQTPGTSTYTGTCFATIASAASSWTNTANAIGYLDAQLPYGGSREVSFTIATVPASIGVNSGGTATADRTTVTTTCDSSGVCTTDTKHDTASFTIRRFPDQSTIITRTATEPDMIDHGNRYPPPSGVLNQAMPPDGVPVENPQYKRGTAPLGQPYPGDATPNEGPWKQDYVTTTGDPSNPPLGLEWGTGTRDADNPNTEEDEDPPTDPDDPGVGEQPEYPDLCEEHPTISACQELGEAPTDEVPKSTFNMVFQAEPLGLPAGCPSPIPVLGYSLSFETACTISTWMAPLVTALGAMVAAMICIAAIRGS